MSIDSPHPIDRPCVLHVVNSLDGGGTERMLISLLAAFDHRKARHIVVTLRDPGPLAAQLPEPVSCHSLRVRGRSRFAWARLGRVTRSCHPSIIHARNTGCWVDAMVAGLLTPRAQVVLGFHGFDDEAGWSGRRRRIARWASRLGAIFTSVSRSGADQLHKVVGIRRDRVHYLPNGIDLERFARNHDTARVRAKFNVPPEVILLGTVGSLTAVKGHELLLDAFAQAANHDHRLRLLIVGGGPLRQQLQYQAESLGITHRVCFIGASEDIEVRDSVLPPLPGLGRCYGTSSRGPAALHPWLHSLAPTGAETPPLRPSRTQDVPLLLSAIDIFVCPSRSEAMSNAILEALAAGRPVIATDVGDNALLVRDGVEGLIIPPNSASDLARAILEIACDPPRRRQFGSAAALRTRSFDFRKCVADYETFYEGLCRCPALSAGLCPQPAP